MHNYLCNEFLGMCRHAQFNSIVVLQCISIVVLFMWRVSLLAVHIDLGGELLADSAQSLPNETRNVLR